MNRKQSSGYILAFLTAATLLAFFALQAGAVTTVTTPITGTVDTTRSGDIQILVSSDGNTLSSDAGGDGIFDDNGRTVSIDKMSGGPDSLAISADRNGIYAGLSGDVQIGRGCGELTINSGGSDNAGVSVENGTVSSDADLVINSGGDGVYNYGGTVNLAGVSIDSKQDGIITLGEQSVTRIRPSAGYNTVSADRYGINVSQSGDVQIGRGSGELTINSGSDGIWVNGGGTVSSDADLVIKSDNYGIRNDGTVNLAGVSIDAKSFGIETSKQAVTRIRPSTDCHTISADDNYGIFVGESGNVMIGRGSGELTINSGKVGVGVGSGATVSSDADLVITSGAAGVANSDGTVNLAGVSIDAKQGNGIENMGTMVISGDHALIRAATSEEAAVAAITNSRGSVSVKTSGDVLLAAKSNASSRNASSLINNRNSGTVSIDAGGQVTFDITAQSARGLYNTSSPAFGDGITVTAAKGVNYAATATSGDAYGIEAANGAALNYGKVNNVAVTATGGDAYGLAATNGGTLSGDGANSISNLSVTENTAGKTAYGVYASGDSKAAGVSIDQLTVKSAGSAYGVNIASDKASSIDITNGLTVSGADANGGAGIYITGAGHSVNVGGALKATGVQYGVYNSGGAVNLAGVSIDAKGSGVSVNGDGQSIVSISPASGYDTINADDSGIAVNHSGKVLIGKGSGTLNINSGAHGVYAADGGIVSSDADLVIKSRGVFNHGGTVNLAGVSIDAKNDLGIYNQGGNLVISGDQTLVKAETTGSNAAYAISNSNNNGKSGSVSIDAVSVQLTARSAHGAAAAISNTGSGAVSIDTGTGGMELIVSAASGDAAAVSNTGGGTVSIKTAGQISYDITAQSAKGMYNTTSLGTGVTVSAAKGSSYKVTSTSGDAYGIAASDNTTLAYGKVNNVAVSATSGNAYGLAATNGGKVSGDGANSIKNVSVKENTAKKYAYGVYAHDGSSITGASIDKLTVDSAGYGSGIDVAGNSSADLTVGAMSVSGDMAAYGVNANGGSVKLAMNGDMAVKSAGDDANGVYAANSDVRFTGAQALTVSADNGGGDGIFAQNSSVSGDAQSLTVSANSSEYVGRGIHAWQSGDVKLALNGDLTVEGRSGVAEGIIASTNSDVKFTGVKAMSVSSGSGGAYGIQSYGSTVSGDLAAMTVTAAESAQGIHASDSGVVNLNAAGSVSVTSKNDSAYGVSAVDKSTVSGDLTSMKVTASGLAEGISAVSSSDVKLEMSGDLSVESKNGTAYGIDAETSSDVTFKGMKAMTVSGDSGDAYGIYAYDNSTVSGDLTSMKVTASGHAKGISAVNSSDVKLAMSGDLSVESKNDNAYGISAGTSSDVTFTGMKAMTVSGDGSQTGVVNGINAFNSTVSGDLTSMNVYGADSGGTSKGILASSSDVKLAMSGDLTVFGKGHEAAGIQALNSSDVTFTGMQAMTVSGDFSWMARGIYANNSTVSGDVTSIDVTSASGSAAGIIAADSGVVNLNAAGPVSITSKNGSAYGIDVSSDKVSSINIAKDLTVKGATGGAGITASGAAHQITVGGLTDVSIAASGDNGVYAADNSNVNLNGGASIDVTGTGEVSGIAANGGSVTVGGNKAIVKASTTGDGAKAYAINNTGSGDITINNTGDVELTASSVSGDAAAIGNSGTGKVTLTTSGQASFDVTGLTAKGLYNTTSQGAGVTVSADKGSNYAVTATSGDAYGLEADNSTLAYGKVNNVTVNATNGNANGLAAMNGGALGSDTAMNGAISATAKGSNYVIANAVYASDISSVKLSGATGISAVGANSADAENESDAYAVNAVGSSDVEIAMNGDMKASGSGTSAFAEGLHADNSKVSASGVKNLIVSATGTAGDESAWGVDATGGSNVALAMDGDMKVSSTGNAYGVDASDSTVSLSDARAISVTADSSDAYGINANDSSAVSADAGSLTAVSNKGAAYGINLYSDHVSSIDVTGDLTVRSAAGGTGITAAGAAHQITVDGLADVAVASNGDSAVYAADGANVNLNGGVSLDVTGTDEVSSIEADGGNVTVGGSKASIKASTTGDGATAYALNNIGSGDITINTSDAGVELTASSVSGDAAAIGNSGTGSVTVATSGQISYDITSQKAKGMYNTTSLGAGVTVNAAGGSNYKITSTNGDAYGLESDKGTLEYGKVNNITVSATGGDAYGLAATDGGSLSGDANSPIASLTVTAKTAGKTAYGVLVSDDKSSAKLSPIEKINVSSAGSGYGLYANSSTDVSGTVRDITVSASNDAYGIYAPDEKTNLDVKVTGVIKAVSETGKAVSIYSKAGTITTDARSADIIGDVVAENGSKQAINMTSSDLTGAVNATGGATVGLSLDAKSVWSVTGDSSTNSELAVNSGTVNFYGNDGDNKDLYRKVIVKTLSGTDGKFLMHADIESGKGDQIVADNSDNLFGKIEIISPKKTGPYRARMADDLVIVRNDKNSSFTLVNNGGCYEYGAWKFVLASEDLSGATIANVTGVSSLAAASDTSGLGWYLLNTQQVSSTATAVFDSLMAPTIGHLEEGALYSQLGDQDWITSGDRTHVWGYAVYSKFKYTDHVTTPIEGTATGDNYAENKYYGLTGGMDKVVHESDSGTFRLGAMMGYGEGDLDMDNGDASDNSFHAGVYGIYRFNSGLYLAGIAKYNRYRTDVTARPTEGGAYEASYNQDGFGISALAGKRFDLRNSWYVEPQAELGWARIGSASYTINNLDVAIDSTNSVRGRLGFALGRKVLTSAGKTLDFYVKASVIREFDGETDLTMSGDPFKADFGGTWGQYKLGVNYWNNDNFMLHGALVYENGENYESPIGVELGLNWFTGPKTQKDEAEAAAEVTE